MGGSMGSVVGKNSPAWWSERRKAVSVIIVCASGGARMQKNAEPDADGDQQLWNAIEQPNCFIYPF